MRKELIEYVLCDLCVGVQENVMRKYLSGGILSRNGLQILGDLYMGTTKGDVEQDESVADELHRYFDRMEKDEAQKERIRQWVEAQVDGWMEELYGVPLSALPYVDEEHVRQHLYESCIVMGAEMLILQDALSQCREEIQTLLLPHLASLEEMVNLAEERNRSWGQKVERVLKKAVCPEEVNIQRAVRMSFWMFDSEIVYLNSKLLQTLLSYLLPDEFEALQTLYDRDVSHVCTFLRKVREMYETLWGHSSSDQSKYLLQPLVMVALPDAEVYATFYYSLVYHLNRYTYRWESLSRINPKMKTLDFVPAVYAEENIWNHLDYWVATPDMEGATLRQGLLDGYVAIVLFSGRWQQTARRFDLPESEVHLLVSDEMVAVYEWKTRLFIQLPPSLPLCGHDELMQRVVRLYGEACIRLKILG